MGNETEIEFVSLKHKFVKCFICNCLKLTHSLPHLFILPSSKEINFLYDNFYGKSVRKCNVNHVYFPSSFLAVTVHESQI